MPDAEAYRPLHEVAYDALHDTGRARSLVRMVKDAAGEELHDVMMSMEILEELLGRVANNLLDVQEELARCHEEGQP